MVGNPFLYPSSFLALKHNKRSKHLGFFTIIQNELLKLLSGYRSLHSPPSKVANEEKKRRPSLALSSISCSVLHFGFGLPQGLGATWWVMNYCFWSKTKDTTPLSRRRITISRALYTHLVPWVISLTMMFLLAFFFKTFLGDT